MGGTKATTSEDGGVQITTLADAIEDVDTKFDSRKCRDENCHGTLFVDDLDDSEKSSARDFATQSNNDDRVVRCGSCYCTPDGVFLPPTTTTYSTSDRDDRVTHGRHNDDSASQSRHPKGSSKEVGHADHVENYYNSKRVILAGGYEPPYDEDDDERPDSVPEEYSFDLTP